MSNTVHENWNRIYDPVPGQYLSVDPMLTTPTETLVSAKVGLPVPAYAYVVNNPIRFSDPSGLSILCNKCSNKTFKIKGENGGLDDLGPGQCKPADGIYRDDTIKPPERSGGGSWCGDGQPEYVLKFGDPGTFNIDCNGGFSAKENSFPLSIAAGAYGGGWQSKNWATKKSWPTP